MRPFTSVKQLLLQMSIGIAVLYPFVEAIQSISLETKTPKLHEGLTRILACHYTTATGAVTILKDGHTLYSCPSPQDLQLLTPSSPIRCNHKHGLLTTDIYLRNSTTNDSGMYRCKVDEEISNPIQITVTTNRSGLKIPKGTGTLGVNITERLPTAMLKPTSNAFPLPTLADYFNRTETSSPSAQPAPVDNNGGSSNLGAWIGGALGICSAFLAMVIIVVCWKRRPLCITNYNVSHCPQSAIGPNPSVAIQERTARMASPERTEVDQQGDPSEDNRV